MLTRLTSITWQPSRVSIGLDGLGAFTGTTVADGVTIKAALQALETVESKGSAASLTSTTAVGDLNTLWVLLRTLKIWELSVVLPLLIP